MAPPPALANFDILYEIFQCLSIYEHSDLRYVPHQRPVEIQRRRSALASAALTCKAFSEPANDVLYEVIPELSAILRTFSGLVKEYNVVTNVWTRRYTDKRYVINGEIQASQWTRFESLARRVHCLSYNVYELHDSLVHLLTSRYNAVPLLPNLRILIWPGSPGGTESQHILKTLCATPTLSMVELGAQQFHPEIERDLSTLSQIRPDLRHLRISYPLNCAAEQVLTTFVHLRSASPGAVGPTLFRHLATLDHLEELHAEWWHNLSHDTADKPFPTGSFPALQRLQIFVAPGRVTQVFCVISAISSTSLTSLTVSFREWHAADTLQCMESISSLPVLLHLRRLDIHIDANASALLHRDGSERVIIVLSDYIRPLLPLRSLEDLSLDVQNRVWSISDSDLETMKNAWPDIVYLSVHNDSSKFFQGTLQQSGPSVQRPSVSTLVAFAQSCRKLETLDIEAADVSKKELVRLETRAAQTAPQLTPQTALNLQHIIFARDYRRTRIVLPVPDGDSDRLVRALHTLFPRLGPLECPREEGAEVPIRRTQIFSVSWTNGTS